MRITLKAARVNAGLTQNTVAMALNVDKKTVGSWENGKTMPKFDAVVALCNLYGVCYDDIQWSNIFFAQDNA